MATAPTVSPTRSLRSLAKLTFFLAPVVLGAILGTLYVHDHAPRWVYWAIGLGFLWVLDLAYAATLAALVVALPLTIRGVKAGDRRRWLRVGVLCGSVALGAVALEGASAVILARQGRASAVPAGEIRTERLVRQKMPRLDDILPPTTFPDDGDRVSIAVIGESSAAGVPFERWFDLGRVVARELRRAIPGREFEAEVLASSGHTLERQHRELAGIKHRPAVLIVYCGHNEFSARIPHSRDRRYYHDDGEPTAIERLTSRAVGWSWLHSLIRRNMEKCRIAIPPPANGRRTLIDVPAYADDEYDRILADFRRRLEAIAAYADEVGAILVLIAPPANDFDYDPNRSYLPPETPRVERSRFERDFLAARELETNDPDAALAAYRALVARAPRFAMARWRLSRLLADRGEAAEAYEHARIARDADGYPQRAPTDFQEAYRELARRRDCVYIDGQAYLHAVSPDGLLDDRLFLDAMHPSYRGQVALAQAVLRGLHARRAFGWPADSPEPTVDPTETGRHFFRLDPNVWRYACHWGMMSYQITGPASFDPALRDAKFAALERAADAIEAGAPPDSAEARGVGRLAPIPIVPLGDPHASP
ncbi:tetratricopeptide repeat protein [Paludisphaera sp.]|uniref:tetratricopeptide repeat protein n=1 Tax=Paludisphaera sp. TaxID=2017432 RepID=UPI00301C995F